jgi:uncharacterized protein
VDEPTIEPICTQSDLIEVRRVINRGRGGRGVFALRDIAAGTLIERVPVILIPKAQVFGSSELAKRAARISWYVFGWEGETKRPYVALALGYGSIYNHSPRANARYQKEAPDVMEFLAVRDINPGEEITINYNGDPNDERAMEFDVRT